MFLLPYNEHQGCAGIHYSKNTLELGNIGEYERVRFHFP